MRLDKLPVGEALVGFLLVALVAAFLVARGEVKAPDEAVSAEPTASGGPTASAAPGELEITMTDNKFDNAELTLVAGEDVEIPLTNNGIAVHNVHVALTGDYGEAFCSVGGDNPCSDPNRIPGGGTGTLTFTVPDSPGEQYDYRCDFHPTEMTGTITVQ